MENNGNPRNSRSPRAPQRETTHGLDAPVFDWPESLTVAFLQRTLAQRVLTRREPWVAEAEKQAAKISHSLGMIGNGQDRDLLNHAALGVAALVGTPVQPELAKQIARQLSRQLRLRSFLIYRVWRTASPAHAVMLGLGTLLVASAAVSLLSEQLVAWVIGQGQALLTVEQGLTLALVSLIGALGGAVSLLTRLNRLPPAEGAEIPLLFWTGFCKPLIGSVSALFVYSAVAAGLIPMEPSLLEAGPLAAVAIAFIAGFSERIVKDRVDQLTDTMVTTDRRQPPPPDNVDRTATTVANYENGDRLTSGR